MLAGVFACEAATAALMSWARLRANDVQCSCHAARPIFVTGAMRDLLGFQRGPGTPMPL